MEKSDPEAELVFASGRSWGWREEDSCRTELKSFTPR